MRVAIVGPGRLGRSLAAYLDAAGSPASLVGRGGAIPACDVVILTVPDRTVAEVAASLAPGPVVLHAAGALDVDVLAPHPERGSLHPLMSFPGGEVALPDPRGLPAAVAGTDAAVAAARELCDRVGFRAFSVVGDRRLYHAAAVIAGNLATVLAAQGAALLRAAGVPEPLAREVLLPLARASVDNSVHGLVAGLTGPLARGDEATLAGHQAAMAEAGLHDLARAYVALVDLARSALVEERSASIAGGAGSDSVSLKTPQAEADGGVGNKIVTRRPSKTP